MQHTQAGCGAQSDLFGWAVLLVPRVIGSGDQEQPRQAVPPLIMVPTVCLFRTCLGITTT
jgi:hypothetical protein